MVLEIQSGNISTSKKLEVLVNGSIQKQIEISPNDSISLCIDTNCARNIIIRAYKDAEEYSFLGELANRIFFNITCGFVLPLSWKGFIEYNSRLALEYIEYALPIDKADTIKICENEDGSLFLFCESENKVHNGLRKCDHISTNIKIYILSIIITILLFPIAFLFLILFEKLFLDGTWQDGAMMFWGQLVLLVILLGFILSIFVVIKNFFDIAKDNKK